jgi:hypothetical protein
MDVDNCSHIARQQPSLGRSLGSVRCEALTTSEPICVFRIGPGRDETFAIQEVSKKTDHPGRALTVCEVCALSDLDNISVRIADVAARLAVLGDRLRDELRSSTFP